MSVVLLVASLLLLTAFDLLRRRISRHEEPPHDRHEPGRRPPRACARRAQDRTRARIARLGLRARSRWSTCSSSWRCRCVMIFLRTFEGGLEPVLKAIARPAFQSAFWLTLQITLIAVPVNTVFGIVAALAIVRRRFPGRGLLNALIDLPFALSPVVIGLSLILVYGKQRLARRPPRRPRHHRHLRGAGHGPGHALRVAAVRRPRGHPGAARDRHRPGGGRLHAGRLAVAHLLAGDAAGHPLGRHLRVILTTARSLGEYGAVAVVSGKIAGKTETLTTHVEERYLAFDLAGAYIASIILALMALLVLLGMQALPVRSTASAATGRWAGAPCAHHGVLGMAITHPRPRRSASATSSSSTTSRWRSPTAR